MAAAVNAKDSGNAPPGSALMKDLTSPDTGVPQVADCRSLVDAPRLSSASSALSDVASITPDYVTLTCVL